MTSLKEKLLAARARVRQQYGPTTHGPGRGGTIREDTADRVDWTNYEYNSGKLDSVEGDSK